MNFDSFKAPVWQLRVNGEGYIPKGAKYHCYVDDSALCGAGNQNTSYYDDGITIESGELVLSPHFACQRCYRKWKREYQVEG